MQRIEFLVQGSSPEPYQVSFVKHESTLRAYCSCTAGQLGQVCKHRLNIINGISDGIVSDNINSVKIIENLLFGTDLEGLLIELKEAEDVAEKAKKAVVTSKKKLSRIMNKDIL